MHDSSDPAEPVIRIREPIEAIETDVVADLSPLAGIEAVIFDVYGTLVISGSGDVGSADTSDRGSRIGEAMAAVGWPTPPEETPTIEDLHKQIRRWHDQRTSDACPKPEVDIVEIWRHTLAATGLQHRTDDARQVARLAAEYEARSNPTWPMPGARELIERLTRASVPIGIVSNAQFFTHRLVADLQPQAESCFDLDLCIFSYRYRQAKPGPRLFDALGQSLQRRGISPQNTVYVGNDMLNDVWAASMAGMKTAWFAGDSRSCRPRSDDPRCRSLRPDLVLTNLMQLLDCLEIK